MKIDKIRIEKIKTWNKHKQKKSKNTKTIEKETLNPKPFKKKKPNKE
jgi:hypothetical protein